MCNLKKVISLNNYPFIQSSLSVVLVLAVIFSLNVFAEESLKLSGIMAGDQPSAIINDQIVSVGDWVGDVQVVAIGQDSVTCQGPKGSMELRLATASAMVSQGQAISAIKNESHAVDAKGIENPSPEKPEAKTSDKARSYLEQSVEYLKQADELLKSPLVYERLYSKAADLCDLADRQAQQVFRFTTDAIVQGNVRGHIDRVRKVKSVILKEKAELATRFRSLIAAHQVTAGMSMRDVTSSWGPPLLQNRDGQIEKWVYQDNNGYQKELIFQDGILIQ